MSRYPHHLHLPALTSPRLTSLDHRLMMDDEQEAMEAELEFHKKQGELSEELDGLNRSLALKQALLAQQPDSTDSTGAHSEEEISALCEALASLESKLKDVETERDAFHRQVRAKRACIRTRYTISHKLLPYFLASLTTATYLPCMAGVGASHAFGRERSAEQEGE